MLTPTSPLPVILPDHEIAALIAEFKRSPADFHNRIAPRSPKRRHFEGEIHIDGIDGSRFRVITRQAQMNPLDFSVILAVELPRTNALFRLRRYNGKSHEHTNRIEGQRIRGFHIHYATERYQAIGADHDGFAEATNRYADFWEAVGCMMEDCSCAIDPGPQGSSSSEAYDAD